MRQVLFAAALIFSLFLPTIAEAGWPPRPAAPTWKATQERAVARKKASERSSTIIWIGVAVVLAGGVIVGLGKTWQVVRGWRQDIGRDKAAWERTTQ
jgi:hypothetical protein